MTAQAIMGILDSPPARFVTAGEVRLLRVKHILKMSR